MPELGKIQRSRDIGYKGKNGSAKYIWSACVDCGKQRWVHIKDGKAERPRCRNCRFIGERDGNWKGGKYKSSAGYIFVKLYPSDFFYPMTNKMGYVLEHRLVIARSLGRCLQCWEVVHHKSGVRDENELENLQLASADGHNATTYLRGRLKLLEKRVEVLEAENIKLKSIIRLDT